MRFLWRLWAGCGNGAEETTAAATAAATEAAETEAAAEEDNGGGNGKLPRAQKQKAQLRRQPRRLRENISM